MHNNPVALNTSSSLHKVTWACWRFGKRFWQFSLFIFSLFNELFKVRLTWESVSSGYPTHPVLSKQLHYNVVLQFSSQSLWEILMKHACSLILRNHIYVFLRFWGVRCPFSFWKSLPVCCLHNLQCLSSSSSPYWLNLV